MKGSTVDPMMNRWVGRQTPPPLYATLWTLCVWGSSLLSSEPLVSVAVMLMAYTLEAGDAARVSWICRFLPIGSTHLSLKMIQRPLTVVSALSVDRHSSSSYLPAAIPRHTAFTVSGAPSALGTVSAVWKTVWTMHKHFICKGLEHPQTLASIPAHPQATGRQESPLATGQGGPQVSWCSSRSSPWPLPWEIPVTSALSVPWHTEHLETNPALMPRDPGCEPEILQRADQETARTPALCPKSF